MVYRLTPAAIDEAAVVSTLRGVLRSHEGAVVASAEVAGRRGGARPGRRAAGHRPALSAVPDEPHPLED
jgi:hypothetical protein